MSRRTCVSKNATSFEIWPPSVHLIRRHGVAWYRKDEPRKAGLSETKNDHAKKGDPAPQNWGGIEVERGKRVEDWLK